MRIPNREHERHSWRIAEIAPDFRLEDAWALAVEGGADDFGTLLEVMASLDPSRGSSLATRLLFRVRRRLGDCLGWDDQRGQLPIPGDTETTLRSRLPEDLVDTGTDEVGSARFTPLYRIEVEWAAELSNQTVHAVMHLAWVDQGEGRYRGQLGVYVKPRGRFGVFRTRSLGHLR